MKRLRLHDNTDEIWKRQADQNTNTTSAVYSASSAASSRIPISSAVSASRNASTSRPRASTIGARNATTTTTPLFINGTRVQLPTITPFGNASTLSTNLAAIASATTTNIIDPPRSSTLARSSAIITLPRPTASTTSAINGTSDTTPTGSSQLASVGGLSTTGKAVLGSVLGGLGGLGFLCALVFLVLTKRKRKRRFAQATFAGTPQRMSERPPTESTPIRTALFSGLGHGATRSAETAPGLATRDALSTTRSTRPQVPFFRPRKASEPISPTTSGFQVISGRRLSSPPPIDRQNPFSDPITPEHPRLGSTPTFYRIQGDPNASQLETGSPVSHVSRFVESLDP